MNCLFMFLIFLYISRENTTNKIDLVRNKKCRVRLFGNEDNSDLGVLPLTSDTEDVLR